MAKFEIMIGYTPGIIGRVSELHAKYYAANWGFGHFFESKVATELSSFIVHYNPSKDRIWSVSVDGSIEGSITIDGTSEDSNIGQLRWFIILDKLKGKGAGNDLMAPARHLYEKFGFKLVEEFSGEQWGKTVIEQRFESALGVLTAEE